MSGGRLVVLDRAGRDVKRFPLAEGLATLGSDPECDIRIMLPSVSPHHATVVVHANQTVVRNVGGEETLVNGCGVSVAALQHGDVIGIGGRQLRWDYSDPSARRPQAPEPALARRAGRPGRAGGAGRAAGAGRGARGRGARRSAPAAGAPRDRALCLALEISHRASMPGHTGGKQVAIVQPQRRDTSDQIDKNPLRTPLQLNKRPRSSKSDLETSVNDENDKAKRKSSPRASTAAGLQATTKASLWIESRRPGPAPGARRSTPLRLAVLRRPLAVAKIQAPLHIDHTKQAALMLMTGRTPRAKVSATPSKPANHTVSIVEISDSEGRNSSLRASTTSRRSGQKSSRMSTTSSSPRKSALRDPSAKRGSRKTESIKFDLSNLENHSRDSDVGSRSRQDSLSEEEVTLRYSESPPSASPSPRRALLSRSRGPLPAPGPAPDGSACRTRTPRASAESYSIVDLVSIDTDDSPSTSVYDSARSTDNTIYRKQLNSLGRKTRSTIEPTLLGSSTPYVKARASANRSRSSAKARNTSIDELQVSTKSSTSRRSKSLSTPENTEDAKKHISVNSTRLSRASRSRSRINDSDLLLVDEDDDSPKTSKRQSTTSKSIRSSRQMGLNDVTATPTGSPTHNEGISTPENRHSPEEASTPVLSIQSLLDSSQSSMTSQRSFKRSKPSFIVKRKTIGVITGPKTRVGTKSKSMNFSARKTRLRLSSESVEPVNMTDDGSQLDSDIVTPKSAVKLVQEGVKNKHSTAKKPLSKRSIIDELNESDIVKQLFNSPVKRKLSQSMTEFSRKQLFDDDEIVVSKRPTRNTIALTGRTPDNSLLDHSEAYTPELFVSPISTPTKSPNLEGIKLLFAKTTPENDLRNVRGVKGLLRTPRTRKSIRNDLTNVAGVKSLFAKSPKNRLSDVRVKEVFASSPKNDLRRISGVKSLFQSTKQRKSPRNELDDVRGVKKLFKANSPVNDLRNVSGVKRILRGHSPHNDLSDVRGVKQTFSRGTRNDLNDVSGVEELFNLSGQSDRDAADSLFDQLVGKPQIKAVYSNTFSAKGVQKKKGRKTKSLHASLDVITNNVEEWLEQELNKRLQKPKEKATTSKAADKSNANMTRELQKLITDTVQGGAPIRASRARQSTAAGAPGRHLSAAELYADHTLPIKKRSLLDAAAAQSGNGAPAGARAEARAGARAGNSAGLPLKKRLVLHSTPVKGRGDLTMNASVLGRVSPIAPLDCTARSTQHAEEITEPQEKSRRGPKANTTKTVDFVKPSPKRTRSRVKGASPAKAEPPGASKAKGKQVTPITAKTSSSDIKKPSPAKVKSPSPPAKAKPASPVPIKVTRSRKKDVSTLSTPVSNTKKRGATLIVTKKSPVISAKLRATRKRKEPETISTPKPSPKKTRATRNVETKVDVEPKTPKTTRAKVQKATVVVSKPSPQLKPRAAKTKANAEHSAPENNRKSRRNAAEAKPESAKKSQPAQKSSKKTKAPVPAVQTVKNSKGRKTVLNQSKDKTDSNKTTAQTRRGRTNNTEESTTAKTSKTDKQEKSSAEPKPVRTRAKNTNSQDSGTPEPARAKATRKRKATAVDNDLPSKVRKSKISAEKGSKQAVNVRNKAAAHESPAEQAPARRGRPPRVLAEPAPAARTTRNKKTNVEVPVKETGKRKRNITAEPSPGEGRSKKQCGAQPATTRASALSPMSKTASRSRRR